MYPFSSIRIFSGFKSPKIIPFSCNSPNAYATYATMYFVYSSVKLFISFKC